MTVQPCPERRRSNLGQLERQNRPDADGPYNGLDDVWLDGGDITRYERSVTTIAEIAEIAETVGAVLNLQEKPPDRHGTATSSRSVSSIGSSRGPRVAHPSRRVEHDGSPSARTEIDGSGSIGSLLSTRPISLGDPVGELRERPAAV